MPACTPCFVSQTSACRQVKYNASSGYLASIHLILVINHIGCVLPAPKYLLATALLELGVGPLHSTAPLCTLCPDNSTANSRQVQKPPTACMYLTATTHHLGAPSRTARGTPFHPPVSRGTWPLRGLLSTGKYLLYPLSPARLSLMDLSHVGGRAKLSLAPALRVEGSKQLAAALQVRRGQAGARVGCVGTCTCTCTCTRACAHAWACTCACTVPACRGWLPSVA